MSALEYIFSSQPGPYSAIFQPASQTSWVFLDTVGFPPEGPDPNLLPLPETLEHDQNPPPPSNDFNTAPGPKRQRSNSTLWVMIDVGEGMSGSPLPMTNDTAIDPGEFEESYRQRQIDLCKKLKDINEGRRRDGKKLLKLVKVTDNEEVFVQQKEEKEVKKTKKTKTPPAAKKTGTPGRSQMSTKEKKLPENQLPPSKLGKMIVHFRTSFWKPYATSDPKALDKIKPLTYPYVRMEDYAAYLLFMEPTIPDVGSIPQRSIKLDDLNAARVLESDIKKSQLNVC